MSYKKLQIWSMSRDMVVDIHRMTLDKLPKFEMYEEGSQIRRSIKSVKSNIVEGYGRRRYKQEYIRFLIYSLASCDETLDHLENLNITGYQASSIQYQLEKATTTFNVKIRQLRASKLNKRRNT